MTRDEQIDKARWAMLTAKCKCGQAGEGGACSRCEAEAALDAADVEVSMSDQHAKRLREAAEQIATAGHYGWGNTCEDAAEHIDALEAELAALRAEKVSQCGHPSSLMLRSAETGKALYCELCDERKRRRDAESMEVHYKARAEKAEAKRDALRKLVTLMQQRAKGGFRAWDADKDAKAGKVLAALAGLRPGYWPDMDELRAALGER